MKLPAFFGLTLLTAGLLTSCGNAADTPAKTAAPATAPAAAETVYECPMGCAGSTSAKPGQCPVCGMDLEKKI